VKRVLLDIQHADAPLGLGCILNNLGHQWYSPPSYNHRDVRARWMSRPDLDHVERVKRSGGLVLSDPLDIERGMLDLVITGRWEMYDRLRRFLPSSTRLGYYSANRFGLPTTGIPHVIGGTKGQRGQHYFLKRVPSEWLDNGFKRSPMYVTSLVSHLMERDKRWAGKHRGGSVLRPVLHSLRQAKLSVKLHGLGCVDRWVNDRDAFSKMLALLHVKSWGSGSDWSVLKACALGVPCIVYFPYVRGMTHEDLLSRGSNVILTWRLVHDGLWIDRLKDLDGRGNRDRLLDLYRREVPERHVAAYLKNVFR
jgi:hypothetical protein